tara:strand:- start:137717 stop:138136 length:420 start_codon:yes stop_codon:yes gene_type:complete
MTAILLGFLVGLAALLEQRDRTTGDSWVYPDTTMSVIKGQGTLHSHVSIVPNPRVKEVSICYLDKGIISLVKLAVPKKLYKDRIVGVASANKTIFIVTVEHLCVYYQEGDWAVCNMVIPLNGKLLTSKQEIKDFFVGRD